MNLEAPAAQEAWREIGAFMRARLA